MGGGDSAAMETEGEMKYQIGIGTWIIFFGSVLGMDLSLFAASEYW